MSKIKVLKLTWDKPNMTIFKLLWNGCRIIFNYMFDMYCTQCALRFFFNYQIFKKATKQKTN